MTTYRLMAKELVDLVVSRLPVARRRRLGPCVTERSLANRLLDIEDEVDYLVERGLAEPVARRFVRAYGSDARAVLTLCRQVPDGLEPLEPGAPYLAGEVVHAVRHESAMTVTDVLTRRLRAAIWVPGQGKRSAERVAQLMAGELGWSEETRRAQVAAYLEELRRFYWPVEAAGA